MSVYALHLLLAKHLLGQELNHIIKLLIFVSNHVVQEHCFSFLFNATLLGTHLVSESLTLLDIKSIFLGCLELLLKLVDSLLGLNEVKVISFSFTTPPLPCSWRFSCWMVQREFIFILIRVLVNTFLDLLVDLILLLVGNLKLSLVEWRLGEVHDWIMLDW